MVESHGGGKVPDEHNPEGRSTCVRGMRLLSGHPPAARFAKNRPTCIHSALALMSRASNTYTKICSMKIFAPYVVSH